MKSPTRVPLGLRRKKEKKKQSQNQDQHKIKQCPSSPSATLSSASSLTQTTSYSSCTSSLARTTQTRQSAEPPGWVHNSPPCTLDEENAAPNHLLNQNAVPTWSKSQHPSPSNTPRRQWGQEHGVPVWVRYPQPPRSNNMPPHQRQNMMTHNMMSDDTIQMTYSSSDGNSISSVGGDTLGPILGLNHREPNDDEKLDFEKFVRDEKFVQQMNKKMKSKNWTGNFECGGTDGGPSLRSVPSTMSTISSNSVDIEKRVTFLQTDLGEKRYEMNASEQRSELAVLSKQPLEEEDEEVFYSLDDVLSPPAASESGQYSEFSSPCQPPFVDTCDDGNATSSPPDEEVSNPPAALLDMERVTDIYGSMMLEFRKKIMSELREEMQKQIQQQLSELTSELGKMNNRLINLENNLNQASAPNLQQELRVTSQVFNAQVKQQLQLEAMLDSKLAKAMVEMNLAVHEVKKEGKLLSKLGVCAESFPQSKECRKSSNNKEEEEGELC